MAIEIRNDLPAEVGPLSWLLGVWEGTGVVSYGEADAHVEYEFGQRISFTNDGLPFLKYDSYYWRLDSDNSPLTWETGFWRLDMKNTPREVGPGLLPGDAEAAALSVDDIEKLRQGELGKGAEKNPESGFPIEVSLMHPDGITELYVGKISGPRIQIGTDGVMRSPNAREYNAAERMYGLVDGKLMWAWDIAALGDEMQSHASAVLEKRG